MKKNIIYMLCAIICVLSIVLCGCAPSQETVEIADSSSSIEESLTKPSEPKTSNRATDIAEKDTQSTRSSDLSGKTDTQGDDDAWVSEKSEKNDSPKTSKNSEESNTKDTPKASKNSSASNSGSASKPAPAAESTPAVPTPVPTPTPTPKPVSKGEVKAVGSGYCQSVLDAVNAIRAEQGYGVAGWDSGLSNKAQSWATSLIEESISANRYKHYHDDNRDSSEGIFWYTDGGTSASTIANEIASHCPQAISSASGIGIGGAVWKDCPIGDDMGFIVVRFYA